jgi:hypothetical protein
MVARTGPTLSQAYDVEQVGSDRAVHRSRIRVSGSSPEIDAPVRAGSEKHRHQVSIPSRYASLMPGVRRNASVVQYMIPRVPIIERSNRSARSNQPTRSIPRPRSRDGAPTSRQFATSAWPKSIVANPWRRPVSVRVRSRPNWSAIRCAHSTSRVMRFYAISALVRICSVSPDATIGSYPVEISGDPVRRSPDDITHDGQYHFVICATR